ncbi:MAG: hypothetical protein ACTSPB_25140 [Candidatus Thorarchaeota archaeon]
MIKASLHFKDRKLGNLINNLARATIEGAFEGCRNMLDDINKRSEKEYIVTANFSAMEIQVRPITIDEIWVEREKKIFLSEEVMMYRSKCYVVDLIKDRGREGGTQPIGWITAQELRNIFSKWKNYIAATIVSKIRDLLR